MAKSKQAKINRERAKRAELALKAQGYWDCGESYAASDLIDDIMHLCIREGWDFEDVLDSARNHFDCEHTSPDDIELYSARPMFAKGDYPIVNVPEEKTIWRGLAEECYTSGPGTEQEVRDYAKRYGYPYIASFTIIDGEPPKVEVFKA